MAKKSLHPAEEWLGKEIRDVASGMSGICSSVCLQVNGNIALGIQPRGDGKEKPEAFLFDVNTVDLIGEGVAERVPPIDTKPEFKAGDLVEHIASDFTGAVTTLHWHMNGCVAYNVASPKVGANGKPVFSVFFRGELRKAKGRPVNVEVAATPKIKSGGPATPQIDWHR